MFGRTALFAARRHAPRRLSALLLVLCLVFVGCLVTSGQAQAQSAVTTYTGTLNGADYKIEVPANWNRVLLLYSHGYVAPGSANPARDVGDPATGAALLAQGYALAGSSYSTTGWALEQAFQDQTALLDYFEANVGHPTRTIAWGHSLGGIITAGLVQRNPERFAGALPMCGVLGGGVGTWNSALDSAFVFKTLAAPNAGLEVVNITNPTANLQAALQALIAAQATGEGRARIGLSAALAGAPGWFTAATPEPAATDYAAREQNQYLWARNVTFPFAFMLRAELEQRAGGNPSWNTGVNYRLLLERSGQKAMVEALYQQAGLSLETDLQALDNAARIAANPQAVNYLTKYIAFNGHIGIPVLTLHTTDDGLVPVQGEQAYASVVNAAGNGEWLRQLFVHRAGHCTFTPAETLTAFQVLMRRITTGQWDNTSNIAALNAGAAALGAQLNILAQGNTIVPTAPAFTAFQPAPFLRPYDLAIPPLAPLYKAAIQPPQAGGPSGYLTVMRSVNGDYQVRVSVTGLAPGSAHAMHFHRGTCELQGAVIQGLPSMVAGRDGSATVTAWLSRAQWAAVVADSTYINIHQQASAPIGGGITCGNVR
ncbi:MAG: prolyl oligopeptidase family serine peptidase [Anaerolineae bacterium]|nr:prolyl oligopeptidase family serine peptidase [Anaerolineae bacterium]